MATPQEQRRIRLANDYREMVNIRGPVIQWRALVGTEPYVERYELTVHIRTVISAHPDFRETHTISVSLPPEYPRAAPQVVMETSPPPYHPNWWSNHKWCYGSWAISEGLGHHVVRMMRTLQFDAEITNPNSPANPEAKDWYLSHLGIGLFPCDRQILPDPTKSRFEIKDRPRKSFTIRS